ncbi:MAG: RNA methyltransferase [Deltaproteobacteria bacterium]|nr:RNA methyltransferase [Deltaproteobacteria bacterium]
MRRADPDVIFPGDGGTSLPFIAPDGTVVEILRPFVSAARIERIERVLASRTGSVAVVLDRIHDPHNGGAVLRSCDAFGIQEILAVEKDEPFAVARRASSGAHKWLDVRRFRDPVACLAAIRSRDLDLYVAEPGGDTALGDLRDRLAAGGRVALAFGNEHDGVAPVLRHAARGSFRIPMSGFVESLNVSVAVGVSLHAVRSGVPGDLADEDRQRLRARFYRQTVREADAIVLERIRS